MRINLLLALGQLVSICWAQWPGDFPPGAFGGRRGGFGGAMGQELKLVEKFDKDGNKRLDAAERKAAREYLASMGMRGTSARPMGRGWMGPSVPSEGQPVPGPRLTPAQVRHYSTEPLYDLNVLRTIFLEFESPDWEQELADFYSTDVEIPARVIVDGKVYEDVGVHFRGQTSYMMVPPGRKRSLNLSFDFVHPKQNLYGYRTLNLLNSGSDPTFLRTVLYLQIARDFFPAPKANFVRVVINGESWGIYINLEQFNADYVAERYGSSKGPRWKVPGRPGARGGLEYLGDDPEVYKKIYEIKTKDDPQSWQQLIRLCKVLNQTPPEQLETALEPILDVDEVLRFLAVEKVLINNDGYWIRSSDYCLYQDPKGRFHIIPYDVNEVMREAEGGPGGRGGLRFAAGSGVELDPLAGSTDPTKPLISRLLAVAPLRARYLSYVRQITEKWLSWEKLEPLVKRYQALIAADVEKDTRKLFSTEAFYRGIAEDYAGGGFFRGPGGAPGLSLKSFVEKRRDYLLSYFEAQPRVTPVERVRAQY